MSLGDYANAITFRFYDTDSRLFQYWRIRAWLKIIGVDLEVLNTRLPHGGREMRRLIGPLLPMHRMSTYAMGAIVNKAVRVMPPGTVFLNIGVWHGFTLFAGMAGNSDRRSIGVDKFSEFDRPREAFLARFEELRGPHDEFFDLDYRDYFAHHEEPIGFYIYDGGHSYEDQLAGLELAHPYLVPGALILVDDTNKDAPREATLKFLGGHAGEYELLADRRTFVNQHPTLWDGIMLLRRCGMES